MFTFTTKQRTWIIELLWDYLRRPKGRHVRKCFADERRLTGYGERSPDGLAASIESIINKDSNATYLLLEVVADIAYELGYAHKRLGDVEPDSRANISGIIDAAERFQTLHSSTDWEEVNYLDEINAFTHTLLKEAIDVD